MNNFVITSAQASYWEKDGVLIRRGTVAPLNRRLYRGLERLCEEKNAELIVLPMSGKDSLETEFHDSLNDIEISDEVRKLNSNIVISDMKVPPQNVDPSSGRTRFAQQDQTLVYAHSKQRLKAIPSSNSKLPKLLMTTGALTLPNYNISNHRGDAAMRDHTLGAIIVEIVDRRLYHARHITSHLNGKFVEMGRLYDGNRSRKITTDSLVLGDLHWGDTDKLTEKANFEMIEFFKPERVILHDTFNGHSINPHERTRSIFRASEWKNKRLSLEEELRKYAENLRDIASQCKRIYVVKSNHDMFLDRYLERGDFLSEPWNAEIALRLAGKLLKGRDPLKEAVKMFGMPKNVTFLGLNSDLKRWGYQLASHGHKGNSGSRRANILSRETAHGKSITAHSHSPQRLRNTYIVGTSTRLDLPYTDGSASSWMGCNAVLYKGGLCQLIPIIEGKWRK